MSRLKPGPPPDTICAIATPPGIGSIAVVRVSGPGALTAVAALVDGPSPTRQPSHSVRLRWLRDASRRRIDQAMVAVYHAPRSYTGEDMVEVSCHGGLVAADAVVAALAAAGCRHARPGEFTRRAVLAGKMDIGRAEAMLELVNARTRTAFDQALGRYAGEVTQSISATSRRLQSVLAEVEHNLGLDEGDAPAELPPGLGRIERELDRTLAQARRSRYLHEGARVAIVGRPNVGKSSLFNRLLGSSRAIVSPAPGTTRDRVHADTAIGDVPVRLTDTAGLSPRRGDRLTRAAHDQARAAVAEADLAIVVLDGSRPFLAADQAVIGELTRAPALFVLNKTDLRQRFDTTRLPGRARVARISCRTGAGIGRLRAALARRLRPHAAETTAFSRRQVDALEACRDALARARCAPTLETAALEIRVAVDMLSQVDAPVSTDKVLDAVFERFCVGK